MTKKAFEKLLEKHDWYYQMSDDPKVFDRGYEEERVIKSICEKDEKLNKIYNLTLKTKFHESTGS